MAAHHDEVHVVTPGVADERIHHRSVPERGSDVHGGMSAAFRGDGIEIGKLRGLELFQALAFDRNCVGAPKENGNRRNANEA